jgi:3-hydroxy-9,10-secoandrosta-1,3,5(10)-triene-9,17-dione monooxygenase reductase component
VNRDQGELTGFRDVLGHFVSGVTVVTAMDDLGPAGLTAQSFCSLSLDPPLVLFCPSKASTSWPRIERARRFCINVLNHAQEDYCRALGHTGPDKFAAIEFGPSPVTGSPLLKGIAAWVDCELEAIHDGGDHLIVVGRVVNLGVGEDVAPLTFWKGQFMRLDLRDRPDPRDQRGG